MTQLTMSVQLALSVQSFKISRNSFLSEWYILKRSQYNSQIRSHSFQVPFNDEQIQ